MANRKNKSEETTPGTEQDLSELKRRFDELAHERTRIEAQQESVQKQLDEIRKQALEQFGTDDVDELKSRLKSMQKENQTKRKKYLADLDKIEQRLARVEAKFSDSITNQSE